MPRVYTEDEQIGRALLNRIDEGDEICISLENGRYYNIEVSWIGDNSLGDKEVFCGDEDRKHLGLVTERTEIEDEKGYVKDVEWDTYAYTLGDDPANPIDKYDIEAFTTIGDGVELPDETVDEAFDEKAMGEMNDMMEEFYEMKDELNYILKQSEKVRNNEITLADYSNRLSAYAVQHGGSFTIDTL